MIGTKLKKEANDKNKALPVSMVIHHIMANMTIDEPKSEANWPLKNKTKLRNFSCSLRALTGAFSSLELRLSDFSMDIFSHSKVLNSNFNKY